MASKPRQKPASRTAAVKPAISPSSFDGSAPEHQETPGAPRGVKLTIRLEPDDARRLKTYAAWNRTTAQAVITDLLRSRLSGFYAATRTATTAATVPPADAAGQLLPQDLPGQQRLAIVADEGEQRAAG